MQILWRARCISKEKRKEGKRDKARVAKPRAGESQTLRGTLNAVNAGNLSRIPESLKRMITEALTACTASGHKAFRGQDVGYAPEDERRKEGAAHQYRPGI